MDDLYDNLLIELECPVCTNYMAPPIRQCATGHSICQPCRKKLPKCPLCQGAFTDSKNISLEALASKMHYPCINRLTGCDARLTLEQRENHERNCSFTGFKCAIDKCPWIGKLEDVLEHWTSKKMKSKIYHSFNVCHSKIKSETYYTNLVEAYGQLFWFKCKLEKGKICWAVQFIGKKTKAVNYFYEIELFRPGSSRPKILFNDYCQSIEIENNDLFKEDVCVTSSIDSLARFVGDDNLLIYYMRVLESVSEESTERQPCDGDRSRKNITKHFNKQRDRSKGAASHAACQNDKKKPSHKESYNKLQNCNN